MATQFNCTKQIKNMVEDKDFLFKCMRNSKLVELSEKGRKNLANLMKLHYSNLSEQD